MQYATTLHRVTHFILTTALGVRYHYCYYFTEEKNKPHKDEATYPSSCI